MKRLARNAENALRLITIACRVTLTVVSGLTLIGQTSRSRSLHDRGEQKGRHQVNHVSDLSPQEQSDIFNGIGEERKVILQMDVKEIVVGKRVEILVITTKDNQLCSPTGNCPVWGFMPDDKHLDLVLSGIASRIEIQDHTTEGVHDLALGTHFSGSESHYTIYVWTGSDYAAADCFVNNLTVLRDTAPSEACLITCL